MSVQRRLVSSWTRRIEARDRSARGYCGRRMFCRRLASCLMGRARRRLTASRPSTRLNLPETVTPPTGQLRMRNCPRLPMRKYRSTIWLRTSLPSSGGSQPGAAERRARRKSSPSPHRNTVASSRLLPNCPRMICPNSNASWPRSWPGTSTDCAGGRPRSRLGPERRKDSPFERIPRGTASVHLPCLPIDPVSTVTPLRQGRGHSISQASIV